MVKSSIVVLASLVVLTLQGCSSDNSGAIGTAERSAHYLVSSSGMTLYTFDKDTLNKSNCDAACQKKWPHFEGQDTASEDIKVIEGTNHLTYRKHPLYYFFKDKTEGDTLGNHVKGVWDVVYAPAGTNDTQTKLSSKTLKQTYLTDKEGRALYTFDKDENGVSHCYDTTPTSKEGCESIWPVFYGETLGKVPAGTKASDFTTITRDSAKAKSGASVKQTAYKGMPLYYFAPDQKNSGSTKGDWVKGVWHLVDID